jgi:signal transduction histidine kinase
VVIANRPRAIAENLFLSFIPDITLPPIWADSDQLSQIATNLIVNAISYTSQGRIEVRTYQLLEEGKVCLQVDDTGVGIPNEDLPYMFDRFYRGSNAAQSSIPGSGLGLAIIKEIVELHQGNIDVQSVLGKGTTFVISLPLKSISPDI